MSILSATVIFGQTAAVYPALVIDAPEALAPIAAQVQKEYSKVSPALWKVMDVKPDGSKSVKIKLIPGAIGLTMKDGQWTLGAKYGGFPAKRYGLAEQLCEATVKASEINLEEPIWGSGLMKFLCIDACRRSGYRLEGLQDIRKRYKAALKYDAGFLHSNLASTTGISPVLREGKGIFLLEQLTVRYPPDFVIHYIRAKRRLIPAGAPYSADDLAAVVSYVAGMDQFIWFRRHSIKVSIDKTKVPIH